MRSSQIYGLLAFALLIAGGGLIFQYLEIRDQAEVIEAASSAILSYEDSLVQKRNVIDDLLAINHDLSVANEDLGEEIELLRETVFQMEEVANSRVCQAVDPAQFENNIYRGTAYVVTPGKMGWPGYWSIRENVILEREYGIARAYEFRINLTPEDYGDFWQEIHTTIRVFPTPDDALAAFNPEDSDEQRNLETSLDIGVLVRAYGATENDPASTMKIEFQCGNYTVEIKSKYIEEEEDALQVLEQAAKVLFDEISHWAP